MATTCGIDEAGRGPVIGPLVICGVIVNEQEQLYLDTLGIKDSKLLTPEKRIELFNTLRKTVAYKTIIVPPTQIDKALQDPSNNLNLLEAATSAEIINALQPDTVIMDCPSNNIPSYVADVKKFLKKDTNIQAEHKADLNHTVVGAASIIAKVTRDRKIADIQKDIDVPIGSGYPSDPVTREFLAKHYSTYPEIFRKEWESYKTVADKKKQRSLGDF